MRILRDDDGVYCLAILDICSRSFWRFYAKRDFIFSPPK